MIGSYYENYGSSEIGYIYFTAEYGPFITIDRVIGKTFRRIWRNESLYDYIDYDDELPPGRYVLSGHYWSSRSWTDYGYEWDAGIKGVTRPQTFAERHFEFKPPRRHTLRYARKIKGERHNFPNWANVKLRIEWAA